MQIDWRGLFDHCRIAWKDKGANTSRGNINVACPWCKDDPSFHLAIEEESGKFFCFRNPKHRGTSTSYLLSNLRISSALIKDFQKYSNPGVAYAKEVGTRCLPASRWQLFNNAEYSENCQKYLWSRGFSRPKELCREFGLKYALEGRWAMRLLLPYVGLVQHLKDEDVAGWIGRAIKPGLEPKYKCDSYAEGHIYFPSNYAYKTLYLVEGPLDALKLAAVSKDTRFTAAAISGLYLSADKLLDLKRFPIDRIFITLDNDQPLAKFREMLYTLYHAIPQSPVSIRRVPEGYKDAAEMPEKELRDWALAWE